MVYYWSLEEVSVLMLVCFQAAVPISNLRTFLPGIIGLSPGSCRVSQLPFLAVRIAHGVIHQSPASQNRPYTYAQSESEFFLCTV